MNMEHEAKSNIIIGKQGRKKVIRENRNWEKSSSVVLKCDKTTQADMTHTEKIINIEETVIGERGG